MRIYLFSGRNAREILRDPINLFFGLAFPLILLLLFALINSNLLPKRRTPCFPGTDDARSRDVRHGIHGVVLGRVAGQGQNFVVPDRLFTSPMRSVDFILGYTLPMIAFALAQAALTFGVAILVGLPPSVNILLGIAAVIPITVLFVGIGLLCGSVMNDKAVGGVCGALLTNVAGWLSGIWFPLDLAGGARSNRSLWFCLHHAAEVARAALSGSFEGLWQHIAVMLGYTVAITPAAVIVSTGKMRSDSVKIKKAQPALPALCFFIIWQIFLHCPRREALTGIILKF
jgi:ABC-2 type transport system permease protein